MSIGHDLLNVPFPEMVYNLGLAIAQSQFNLDKRSIEILRIMGDKEEAPVYIPNFKLKDEAKLTLDPGAPETYEIKTSMIGAGFQPTFYQFAETIIEVKIAISIAYESKYEKEVKGEEVTTRTTRSKWWGYPSTTTITTTPVDAKYSNKYNYTAEGSSLLRTRLVPMPANSFIQRMLDMKAQAMQMAMELEIKKVELAVELAKAKMAKEIETLEDNAKKQLPPP